MGQHDYAFVHMTLKLQRTQSESRQEVGEMLFDLIEITHFASRWRAVTWRFHLRSQSCTRR